MPSITDPEAIRFINEQIRPLCEEFRLLKAKVNSCVANWFVGVNAKIPGDDSTVDDGREDQGASRLTGADVVGVMVQLLAFQSQLDQGGVAGIIAKPCVRPFGG